MSVEILTQPMECQNFISGNFKKASGTKANVISPYNGNIIGEFHNSTVEDVNHAVQEAVKAQKDWAEVPMKERTKVMFNFRQILLRNLDEIANLKSSESGKCLAEGRAGLMKGIEVLEFAIALQNMDLGGKTEVSRGVSCEYRREPLGVVANITPFNFPAMVRSEEHTSELQSH